MSLKKYAVILSIIVVACTGRGSLDKIGGPAWVFDPYAVSKDKNEIAAVGISDPSHGGVKMQIAQAENDALGNLASQIQTKVDKVVEDSVNQEQNIKAGEQNKKEVVAKSEDISKKFSAVTKNIVDKLPLSGARRTDIWQDPKTGTLYVRMVMDVERVQAHFKKSVQMYQNLGAEGVDKSTVKKLTDALLGEKLYEQQISSNQQPDVSPKA